jgi:predicted nucleotidyltransferase
MLVDDSEDNIRKIKKALKKLLPEACNELKLEDVKENIVVRMVGEDIIVDLMSHIGDIDYITSLNDREEIDINGVSIPVAGLDTMLELKKGIRDTDKRDYLFLKGKKEFLGKKKR